MKRLLLRSVCLLALTALPTKAAILYWDKNDIAAGAGASPGGAWTDTAWNAIADGTGTPGAWVAGSDAVFSAGTDAAGSYTITSGAQSANSVTVEDGKVVVNNTSGAITVGAGGVTINSGATYSFNSTLTLLPSGTPSVTLNGGALENRTAPAGSTFLNTSWVLVMGANGGTLNCPGAANSRFNLPQIITGPGSFTLSGAGSAMGINGTSTYAGSTTINSPMELRLFGTNAKLPAGTDLIINGPSGVFNVSGSAQANPQTVASLSGTGIAAIGSTTLTINGSASTTFSGVLQNSFTTYGATARTFGRLSKQGSGTLTLAGVNTYDGSFTNVAGTTTVNSGATLCGPTADVVVSGGTLNLNNAAQTILSLSGSGGTINLASGHTLTVNPSSGTRVYSGTISGAGAITKTGAGNLALAGNNDYTGNTTVSVGKIRVDSANALGSAAGYTEVASGAEILFDGAAINLTCNENFRLAGAGADGGAITVQNLANVTLSGTVTLTGDATNTVSGTGTVLYNNPNAVTSLADQNLTLQGGAGVGGGGTISGVIALGAGGLTKRQGGRWVLSGVNTYAGPTAVTAGTLLVNSPGSLAAGSAVTVSSGATLGGNGTINGPVTVDGTLAPGTSIGTLTLDLSPTLNGTLTMEIDKGASPNADKLVVNNALTFAGTLTVNNTGATLTGGEVFDLFDAPSFSGSFSTQNLPSLSAGMNWWLGNLTVTGSIKVNRAPAPGNETLGTPTNTPVSVTVNKLKSQHPDADGDTVTLTLDSAASAQGGTVTESAGTVTYTPPNATFGGTDSFTYTLDDAQGGTTVVTVNVTVGAGTTVSPNVVHGPLIDGNDFVVRFAGIPGETYTIEHSAAPTGPWTKLENKLCPTDNSLGFGIGVFEVREDTTGSEAGFYRTVHPSY